MVDDEVHKLMVEIAKEAINEGRTAKGFAEKKSGIILSRPLWMQDSTYSSLSSIWRKRKDLLIEKIEIGRGEASKLLAASVKPKVQNRLSLAELQQKKVEKKLKRLERLRQETLCKEMMNEEVLSRDFYRWELKLNLSERRIMREEDQLALLVRKEEEKRKLLAESMYALAGIESEEVKKVDKTFDRRRQELKELAIERRRRAEDQAYMTIEDKLGEALREIDKAERQKKKYLAELGEFGDDEEGKKEEEEKEEVMMVNGKPVVKIPDWLRPPLLFYDWDLKKQTKYVQMMIRVHVKTNQIQKKIEKEKKFFEKMSQKSYKDWYERFKIVEQAEMEAELKMIEAEEELKEAESKIVNLNENISKLATYCRDKGEEELKMKSTLNKLEEFARRRDRELLEADNWLNLCIRRSKTRDKLKRKVTASCKYVDTESLNGFHQRFETKLLRERLYMTYFQQIVGSILNRSEIIATERKIMFIQEQLSINKSRILDRQLAMKNLISDMRRDEHMRMRRSFLNEKFFGKNRKNVLKERFGGWVRYFLWNRGHKEAFELKYEVIKRQLELDRQFKEQLKTATAAKKQEEKGSSKVKSFQTLMHKHRERTIQCKSCLKYYIESQNNSLVCDFHPKQFILACPGNCPNPGLTTLCASHRMRRWTCCNSVRQEGLGCSRRCHQPPDSDPVYDKIMTSINERDRDFIIKLDEKVKEAREQDFPAQLNMAKKTKIFEMEDKITEGRNTAERYRTLKFV